MKYSKQRVIRKEIPDNDANGLTDTIKFQRDLSVKSLQLSVNIEHPYNGDVSIDLTGPNGKTVNVLSPGRGPGKNVKTTFSDDLFQDFVNIKSKGDWTIKVADNATRDNGKLVDWQLDWVLANSKKTEVYIKDDTSLSSVQYCHQFGAIETMTADVHIEHGHIADLVVVLTAPSGKSVTLHDRIGGSANEIKKTYSAEDLSGMVGETAKGKWKMSISDNAPRDGGRLVSWKLNVKTADRITAPIVKAAPLRDDLKKIEGIGPKIEGILNNADIKTFQQLSSTAPGKLKELLNAAGPRYQMHDPGSWPRQAKLAAEGRWDELETLQDQLQGGR